jgi:hypothetical protein
VSDLDWRLRQQELLRERQQRVLLALLNVMSEMDYPYSAETIFTDALATGFQGGDAGHGGHASVTFTQNAGTLHVAWENHGRKREVEDVDSVTVTVGGDWEQSDLLRGLIQAAVTIARELYGDEKEADA